MNLQTKIKIQPIEDFIDYNSNLLLVGSCFSENIGQKLQYFKYPTMVNPLGILFHSKAIEKTFLNCISRKLFTDNDIFFHNEQWNCFDVHSSRSAINPKEIINNLNIQNQMMYEQIQKSTHVIITLGTSWVYKYKKSNKVVANCHKIPQREFLKSILSVSTIIDNLKGINKMIQSVNKNVKIIYTVSPIRHSKDGFVQNMQSKAHLLTAVHSVVDKQNVFYFPSYEIMMDELRDYRFYADDMLHPNTTAISYIWERFSEIWLDKNQENLRKQIDSVQKGLNHRPFNKNAQNYLVFKNRLQEKIKNIEQKYPQIQF